MSSFSGQAAARNLCSHLIHSLFLFFLILIPLTESSAQSSGGTDTMGTGGRNTIQGRIYFPSGRQADVRAKVKLETVAFSNLTVIADADGAFSFRNLAPGSYTIVVEAGDDYEPARESVFIDGQSNLGRRMSVPMPPRTVTVPIHLQPKRTVKIGPKPGVLNVALANVPKDAANFYTQAAAAAQAGETKKAIEHLKSAISIYPEFTLALNELGVQYLKLGQVDKAVGVLAAAVKYAPDAFSPRLNYGIALLEKREFAAAEVELRKALKINDASRHAHLYLGITLISLQNYDEAEQELKRASTTGGDSISLAHYYLGGLYWRKEDYQRAVTELETYLRLAPNAPNAERVRETIKQLRAKQGGPGAAGKS
jgi:tetratricopeptide (TPR) repeat protein